MHSIDIKIFFNYYKIKCAAKGWCATIGHSPLQIKIENRKKNPIFDEKFYVIFIDYCKFYVFKQQTEKKFQDPISCVKFPVESKSKLRIEVKMKGSQEIWKKPKFWFFWFLTTKKIISKKQLKCPKCPCTKCTLKNLLIASTWKIFELYEYPQH